VSESWAVAWAGGMADPARRFNPNHAAAGSAAGGQFASAGGGSGAKGGAGKTPAHHVAQAAHEKHVAAVAAGAPGRAARRKQLLGRAHADREKAAVLEKELHGLRAQEAKAVKAAAHAKAAAQHAAAQAAMTPAQKAAAARKHAAHRKHARHHASLKARISGLHEQIGALLKQAKTLESEAAKL
jgi:hypothetical protein